MIGVDTNILVRYVTQDDETQFYAALRLLNRKGATFFVSSTTILELDWVLRRVYGLSHAEVAESIARLQTLHNLIFEDGAQIRGALWALRKGADLADALIAARCREHGCRELATFDADFAKLYPRFAFVPK